MPVAGRRETVQQEHDACLVLSGCLAKRHKQVGEILTQIAGVSAADERVDIDADLESLPGV